MIFGDRHTVAVRIASATGRWLPTIEQIEGGPTKERYEIRLSDRSVIRVEDKLVRSPVQEHRDPELVRPGGGITNTPFDVDRENQL